MRQERERQGGPRDSGPREEGRVDSDSHRNNS